MTAAGLPTGGPSPSMWVWMDLLGSLREDSRCTGEKVTGWVSFELFVTAAPLSAFREGPPETREVQALKGLLSGGHRLEPRSAQG